MSNSGDTFLDEVLNVFVDYKMAETNNEHMDDIDFVRRATYDKAKEKVILDAAVEKYYQEEDVKQKIEQMMKDEVQLAKREKFGYFAIYTVFIASLLGIVVNQVTNLLIPITQYNMGIYGIIILCILLILFCMFGLFKDRNINCIIIKRVYERVKNDICFWKKGEK